MIHLDKAITKFEVVKPNEGIAKTAESMERPHVLQGNTYKIKTPLSEHALYITINDVLYDGMRRPYEIFINSKAMEHFQWIVALTRVISAVFRKEGDCTFLIDELQSVFDPKGGYFKKGKWMPSLVAEIGEVIEQHLSEIGLYHKDSSLKDAAKKMLHDKQDTSNKMRVCPSCGQPSAVVMDGCLTCTECGYSKCS